MSGTHLAHGSPATFRIESPLLSAVPDSTGNVHATIGGAALTVYYTSDASLPGQVRVPVTCSPRLRAPAHVTARAEVTWPLTCDREDSAT
eukprot:1147767-Rhodomonas_salina.2